MDNKRRNEIAYQLLLMQTSQEGSFRDLKNAGREIGNLVKKKEIKEKNISGEELKEFGKNLYKKSFQNAMEDL